MNKTAKSIILNMLIASAGLFTFGFGVYLTIQANLGAAPWDVFELGISGTFGIKYGTAAILVSLTVLCIDVALREKIGIGMFLDAFIVGKTVDLFNSINLVPAINNPLTGAAVMISGLIIMGFSQYLYMKAALGCGPRDTMLVGLSRRLPKIPIGVVSIGIMTVVAGIGRLLGGPLGVGTLICAFLAGPIMQFAFRVTKFNATEVSHQGLKESFEVFAGKKC